ncbi:MAG TPA: chemotaxis protein CheB [Opitutaceae bacterium]
MKKKKKAPTRRATPAGSPANRSVPPATDAPPAGDRLAGVVGVGASAGGLEALATFLQGMPADSGIASVIVTHQHPGHASLLPELLRKHTSMTVSEEGNGVRLEPNHVYLSRPDYCVSVEGTLLRLAPLDPGAGLFLPIDYLFRSLAENLKERAIGIVLSGTGTDGTLGLRAIKGAAGLALAQTPGSAKFPGMPQSAVATGMVDFVVAPDQMGTPLLNHVGGIAQGSIEGGNLPDEEVQEPTQRIIALLRIRTGHDFSSYKPNTIRRRIERRMSLQQIERLGEYVRFLQGNPHEIEFLAKELLIGVTNFFCETVDRRWKLYRRKPAATSIGTIPSFPSFSGFSAHAHAGAPSGVTPRDGPLALAPGVKMQSLNEELQSVNVQLQSKVEELSQTSDEMQNLLNSTEIATIFLDGELRIKSFTSEARHLIKLIATDVGRSIGDLMTNLDYETLQADAAEVMRTLVPCEREVRTTPGDWRLVRIVPYRTDDNDIDGLVVMFVDINKDKRAELMAERASVMANSILATIRESLLVSDAGFSIISANPAIYRDFQLRPADVEGRELFMIADGVWDVPELRRALERLATSDTVIQDYKLRHDFRDRGSRSIVLNARRLEQPPEEPGRFLIVMEDITTWESRHASTP